jgi:glycosyltransferase involved in cell wall biosynthesis
VSRVLVVASDHVGSSMAGPGIRSLWFARELSRRGHEVMLVVPFETDLEPEGFELRLDNPWHGPRMAALARNFDAVVAQRLPAQTMMRIADSRTRAVYDLYAPLTIEHVALEVRQREPFPPAARRLNELTQRVALESGDAFICASERQRDLFIGGLLAAGRLDAARYAADPSLRGLIDVVPFGIDPEPPVHAGPVVKGVVPGIGEDDKLLLWNGGVWNWFDPLTVIRAVARLGRDDVKLYFLGTKHPNPGVPAMAMTARAVDLAGELGLFDRSVFFNFGWVPYDERGAYLLEADVGVSAHFDELETRFAFRTRLLDCFWASLPVVTTDGDTLADLVRERGLGHVVAVEDVDGWVQALRALLDDEGARERVERNVADVRRELEWPRAIEPLVRLIEMPKTAPVRKPSPVRTAEYVALRVRFAFLTRGVAGVAKRLLVQGPIRRVRGDRAAYPPIRSRR